MSGSRAATPRAAENVRVARSAEDRKLADVVARAFYDDPVMTYLVPSTRTRYARLVRFFRAELVSCRARGEVLTTDDQSGVAMWLEPGRWKVPDRELGREAIMAGLALGRQIPAGMRVLAAMERAHPSEEHWYLGVLGTDPVRQGRGVAGRLITTVTDRCDAEGIPAYVETGKRANVAYYARFGFEQVHEIPVEGGPMQWGMWRDPR